MGRWGTGLYESDGSLDYLSEIIRFLKKEAAYLFSPEEVHSNAIWLRDALTVVEMMLILAKEEPPEYLNDQHIVIRRWQDIFLGVWDDEWDDVEHSDFPYSDHAYRLEQRQIAVTLFDRLGEIADYWRDDLPEHDLQPFLFEGTLPYFSLIRLKDRDNREYSVTGSPLHKFIHMLIHRIIFVFSEENAGKGWGFAFYELENVWVCVDLIGRLCEKYPISPGLRPATIHRWLDRTIGLWLESYAKHSPPIPDVQTLAEKEGLLYTNVVETFVRLITAAQQHPGRL